LDDKSVRNIVVNADASSIEHWRKQVVAGQLGAETFAFVADEGSYIPGGEGTAPSPLTYFTAGVALCLLSQLSIIAGKKKIAVRNEHVKVTARFHEQGSVLQGTKNGVCDGFDVEISLESNEPKETIAEMIRLARQMCFADYAISHPIAVNARYFLNGEEQEAAASD
jgi:uncharacterized OsmC-like protein